MRVLGLFVITFAAVLALPKDTARIIGGSVTTIDQYPFSASVLKSNDFVVYTHDCGGSILTTTAILTATHCFSDSNPNRSRVRVGSTFASSGGVVHSIRQIILHQNYDTWTQENDIAILRTGTFITYTNTVQPASISGPNYNVADNQPVWAIGWGVTQFGSTVFSEQLRHVEIWVINQALCAQRYNSFFIEITDNMMCSGWLDVGGRDACTGDSGGPLIHNNVVVGVASFGINCGDPFFPGVHTRVSRYIDWITANTQ